MKFVLNQEIALCINFINLLLWFFSISVTVTLNWEVTKMSLHLSMFVIKKIRYSAFK